MYAENYIYSAKAAEILRRKSRVIYRTQNAAFTDLPRRCPKTGVQSKGGSINAFWFHPIYWRAVSEQESEIRAIRSSQ